ncbi:MAG: hypothetical protein FWG50_05810 [Kiritimatiellaeota bacterium]|nr:hypothetical protein [Kiritimatiellota bacterium]
MEKKFVEMDDETFAYFSERAKEEGVDVSEYLHNLVKSFSVGVVTPVRNVACTGCA